MTKKRLDSIKRIQAVQEKLRSLAEAKLGELDRREMLLKATRNELIATLNDDQVLHGLFLDSLAKRVTKLSIGIAHVERAREAQAKELLEQSSKLKRVERIAKDVSREHEAALEKKELAELIDRLRPSPASLP